MPADPPTDIAPAARLLDTTVADFLAQHVFGAPLHIVVGVSGGPDSLALLHSLHAVAPQTGAVLVVAHLNHGLRGADADADAAFVAAEAERLGLPFYGAVADVAAYAAAARLSTEDAARRARHAFFHHLCAALAAPCVVALAHTADDQAETVLLHLLRGAGLDGLRGMAEVAPLPAPDPAAIAQSAMQFSFDIMVAFAWRSVAPTPNPSSARQPFGSLTEDERGGTDSILAPFPRSRGKGGGWGRKATADNVAGHSIIRPLLSRTRAEIEAAIAARALTPRTDATNTDPHYARNRVRHAVIPALAAFYGDDDPPNHQRLVATLTRMADLLAGDDAALDAIAARAIAWTPVDNAATSCDISAFAAQPRAIQRRSVRLAYAALRGTTTDLTAHHTDSVIALTTRTDGSQSVQLPQPIAARRAYNRLELFDTAAQTPPRLPRLHITAATPPFIAPNATARPTTAVIDAAALAAFGGTDYSLTARPVRPGDRFWPLGAPGHRKLQDVLVDKKIPAIERPVIPVIVAHWPTGAEMIVWLGTTGYIDERLKCTPATTRALRLTLTP